ncbi:hypothetical protein ABZ464_51800 [Streptomyces sp. NPDC005820]|uniref:hypothetical protein n=1 Tax=Streptomyces sp. NPDC005820 TaxID=3157069 RepID=UPI0034036C8B
MTQTKFDRQVEETAEALMFGIGRFLGGRDMDGIKRTDATFWQPGTRVLPKVEGRVARSSYRAGWQRLTFRFTGLSTAAAGDWGLWEHQETARTWWENPDAVPVAALQTGGIGAASVAAAGGLPSFTRSSQPQQRRTRLLPLPLGRPGGEQGVGGRRQPLPRDSA